MNIWNGLSSDWISVDCCTKLMLQLIATYAMGLIFFDSATGYLADESPLFLIHFLLNPTDYALIWIVSVERGVLALRVPTFLYLTVYCTITIA